MAKVQRTRGVKPALSPDTVQHLHALAGIVADGMDPAAGCVALAEATARALTGATVYVVLGGRFVRGAPQVVAVAGEANESVHRGPVPQGRFELAVLASGQSATGAVPWARGQHFAAVPVAAVGAAPEAVLVAVAPRALSAAALDVLYALGALGAVLFARTAVTVQSLGTGTSIPPPDLEALAEELTRLLAAGLDALPEVVSRLSDALGAVGAWCLLVDGAGGAEVVASAGMAGHAARPTVDKAWVQRVLARRAVITLAPATVPELTLPGAVEILVVPLVTQDALQGALVFAFPHAGGNHWLARLLAEPLAVAVLRSREQDAGATVAADWDRALSAVESPVWLTDSRHAVLRANRAARLRLDATAGRTTCRDVLGGHCPDVCDGGAMVTVHVTAPGGRYVVRGVHLASGGAMYVALPVPEDSGWEAEAQHRRAAAELALVAVVEAETPLAGLSASLASLLQEVGRGLGGRALEDRLRQAWHGVTGLQRSVSTAMGYFRTAAAGTEPCDVRELVYQAVSVARARLRGSVEFRVDADELPLVQADRGRLLETVASMLPEAGGFVAVKVRALPDEVELRVEGTSVGLQPVTERMARECGGWALATTSGGVMLRIPTRHRVSVERGLQVTAGTAGPDTEIPPPLERRSRVLVVDDEPFILRAYQRILRSRYDVVTAGDGDEALALLAGGGFDAILTDVNMPLRGGLDLYSEVVQRWPSLAPRLVFMTGGVPGDEAEKFLQSTTNRVLRKPLVPEVLREALAEVLDGAGGW